MAALQPFKVAGLTEAVAFEMYASVAAEVEHRSVRTISLDEPVRRPSFLEFYGHLKALTPEGCFPPALHFWTCMTGRDLFKQLPLS